MEAMNKPIHEFVYERIMGLPLRILVNTINVV